MGCLVLFIQQSGVHVQFITGLNSSERIQKFFLVQSFSDKQGVPVLETEISSFSVRDTFAKFQRKQVSSGFTPTTFFFPRSKAC